MADDILHALRCDPDDCDGKCYACRAADLIESQQADIERLRTIAERLYIALDAHYGVGRDGTDHFTRMALASYEEEARRD